MCPSLEWWPQKLNCHSNVAFGHENLLSISEHFACVQLSFSLFLNPHNFKGTKNCDPYFTNEKLRFWEAGRCLLQGDPQLEGKDWTPSIQSPALVVWAPVLLSLEYIWGGPGYWLHLGQYPQQTKLTENAWKMCVYSVKHLLLYH